MANGFGSLWIGATGIKSASNGLNVTSNNLTNVNSSGYVREQVVYADMSYTWFGNAAVSKQLSGLGVDIGDVVHARDVFLDKAYRTETGRYKFYNASYEAVEEVETFLQETEGAAFKDAIADMYVAFSEFAKDPSDTVNQNLILQKAGLFLARSSAVYQGLIDYQTIINTKIRNDVDRINKIGQELRTLNKEIQRIEAGHIETAMTMRDERDVLLDELAGLTNIAVKELDNGCVKVQIEGTVFVDEVKNHPIELLEDPVTGFVTPYWKELSDVDNGIYFTVWHPENVDADKGNDIGEVKALLLARGDEYANYTDINYLDEASYELGISNSIMMNSEAELDKLVNRIMVEVNQRFSPIDTAKNVYGSDVNTNPIYYRDEYGDTKLLGDDVRVADVYNCSVGSDGEVPPQELFKRAGCERYTRVLVVDGGGNALPDQDGNLQYIWLYNEEPTYDPRFPDDRPSTSYMYTLRSTTLNQELVEQESLLAHKHQNGNIAYDMGESLESLWNKEDFTLNPSDKTPCSFISFYTKWVGEIGTTGSVYYTTSFSLEGTSAAIESNRQAVIGVSSDEELANIIKYQSAYNAASRYMTTISNMIEHLLNTLGT